ncbi:MAG TPA: nickel-dependent lactate racemase [Thermoleophilia bacterium]|nr:nickel-dependent lactate racemase [Thermoleophilia bacterium]
MKLTIPYGDTELAFEVPDAALAGVLSGAAGEACAPAGPEGLDDAPAGAAEPGRSSGLGAAGPAGAAEPGPPTAAPTAADEEAEIRRALAEPIGAPRLRELAAAASSAVIVVSDVTRPCPSHKFLPGLLEELRPLPPEAVTIVFALGGHRPHTPEEQRALVGEEVAASGVRLLDLDRDDCVPVGTTSRGTPLAVFRPYLESGLRVCTGNIEYHYFAGFSGGAKAVVPGICTDDTIRANHGMMLDERAKAGILDGNPVREDIDEAGGMIGIDFLLNVVLDEERRVVRAVAGDYLAAHRAGVALHDARCDLRVYEAADVVVASPGGTPKDMNLYQAQKTLDNVAGAVRDGGVIVLVACCREGLGNAVFAKWMTGMRSPRDLVDRIRREFVLGGHKAAAIAALLERVDLHVVSELPDDLVRAMHMTPFDGVDAAVTAAVDRAGRDARILVIPHGGRVTARRGVRQEERTA